MEKVRVWSKEDLIAVWEEFGHVIPLYIQLGGALVCTTIVASTNAVSGLANAIGGLLNCSFNDPFPE